MIKKILIPILMLSMVFFIQCQDESIEPDNNNPALKTGSSFKKGKAEAPGGGGSGTHGNGGLNTGNGGKEGIYGDLVICLRTPDGIPMYKEIVGEHDPEYFPLPIKITEDGSVPSFKDGQYETFELNAEGDVIPEDGFIVLEVDMGRLNMIRAPQSVFVSALDEAILSLTQPGVTAIKTDGSGRLIAIVGAEDWVVNYDDIVGNEEENDKTIDSPRENLALYQELLSYRLTRQLSFLTSYGFTDDDVMSLAIGAYAAGSDKTAISLVDEICYLNDFFLDWKKAEINEPIGSPDVKGRHYYNFDGYIYNRAAVYGNKFVKITTLNSDGTWTENYRTLFSAVPWTHPMYLIDYEGGQNKNLTGFSNATNDAIQVLEFIHESDLIEYNPYFTANGLDLPD